MEIVIRSIFVNLPLPGAAWADHASGDLPASLPRLRWSGMRGRRAEQGLRLHAVRSHGDGMMLCDDGDVLMILCVDGVVWIVMC